MLYYCQCSTCFGRFLLPPSGAQELYTQHLVCARLACCYPPTHSVNPVERNANVHRHENRKYDTGRIASCHKEYISKCGLFSRGGYNCGERPALCGITKFWNNICCSWCGQAASAPRGGYVWRVWNIFDLPSSRSFMDA